MEPVEWAILLAGLAGGWALKSVYKKTKPQAKRQTTRRKERNAKP